MPARSDDDMKYDASTPPDPKAWLEADEDERKDAIARYHRRFKGAHPRAESQLAHDTFHVIVENQLAMGEPPQARAALERLLGEGLDRHEAVHAIASRLTALVWETTTKAIPFSEKDYASKLEALTAESWRSEAADDSSPDRSEGGYAADDDDFGDDIFEDD